MDRSLSPEGAGHLALLAAAEEVTGLVLAAGDDADGSDSADVSIKEEEVSSPLSRMQELKFRPAPSSPQTPQTPQAIQTLSGPPPPPPPPPPPHTAHSRPTTTTTAAGGAAAQGHSILRPGRHGGKAGVTSKAAAALRGPPAPGQPIVPRRVEDWEPWKEILHELYIAQNRILRDIIEYMEAKYNLKAT